jgi:polyphosphate kinase
VSTVSTSPTVDVDERILNRELSWLDFNTRVLALADEPTVPLLERVKFVAIFASNLDEFFQVRVAALKDQMAAGIVRPTPDGRTPAQQLIEISDRVEELVHVEEELFLTRLVPSLRDAGIELSSWDDLDEDERKHLVDVFERRIFPVLTPLAVDPGHPFPYISNLSLNLAVLVREPGSEERVFARVKVPSLLPRFLPLPDGTRFVPIEQVIASQLDTLFPGMIVEDRFSFRVTRNADLTLEEEADDLLQAVEMELRRRRFGRAVRLEVERGMTPQILELLLRELDLQEDDVSHSRAPLDLTGLFLMNDLDRPDLKYDPWPPATQARLSSASDSDKSMFSVLREHDVLVQHPYDSFATSTEEFIGQASEDRRVLTIKMTLYRTSGDSPIVRSLIRAAERGVQVAVLIEVKARFDEQANIAWAKELERAGVHVVYGFVGLKTHSKCVLVVRDEDDGIRRYLHIGTGNYNSFTARIYEDFGLLSCDPALGADLTQLFNHLTGYSREVRYRKLLVAPQWMRHQFQDLILGEAAYGRAGRITLKINSLVDPAMVESLYQASAAGVQIDLIVRGICCLRPGVPGLSETIRVRSIVGRYLEHSRIMRFGNGSGPGRPAFFLGSADLMPRNLDRRVEVVTPIESTDHQARLEEVLAVCLADDVLAWELEADGEWRKVPTVHGVEAQRRMYELALLRARRGPERD